MTSTPYPKIQPSWIWPDAVERWFRERAKGYTLHVCCGKSTLGDVRVDADPENEPDILGDAHNLPFDDCSFDTAIIDPPWNVNPYKREEWYWPCVEAVKPDGLILVNATWIPWSHQTVIEECAVRQDYRMGKPSLLVKTRRHPGQQTL